MEIGLRPGEKMFEELHLNDEMTTKTKNNLIFKINVMEITEDEIHQKLAQLEKALDEPLEKEDYRKLMLEMIQEDSLVNG